MNHYVVIQESIFLLFTLNFVLLITANLAQNKLPYHTTETAKFRGQYRRGLQLHSVIALLPHIGLRKPAVSAVTCRGHGLFQTAS